MALSIPEQPEQRHHISVQFNVYDVHLFVKSEQINPWQEWSGDLFVSREVKMVPKCTYLKHIQIQIRLITSLQEISCYIDPPWALGKRPCIFRTAVLLAILHRAMQKVHKCVCVCVSVCVCVFVCLFACLLACLLACLWSRYKTPGNVVIHAQPFRQDRDWTM